MAIADMETPVITFTTIRSAILSLVMLHHAISVILKNVNFGQNMAVASLKARVPHTLLEKNMKL